MTKPKTPRFCDWFDMRAGVVRCGMSPKTTRAGHNLCVFHAALFDETINTPTSGDTDGSE